MEIFPSSCPQCWRLPLFIQKRQTLERSASISVSLGLLHCGSHWLTDSHLTLRIRLRYRHAPAKPLAGDFHWDQPVTVHLFWPVMGREAESRKHVKDLWVMTNHRPNLVFLHVHPVGKSGRTGEQAHEVGHKVQQRFWDKSTNQSRKIRNFVLLY